MDIGILYTIGMGMLFGLCSSSLGYGIRNWEFWLICLGGNFVATAMLYL